MQGIRQVISTLADDGQEVMGPRVLVCHYPDDSIVNNTLLTVESNHFCVLKSRNAILNVLTQDNTRSRRPTGLSSALSHRLSLMALRAMRSLGVFD